MTFSVPLTHKKNPLKIPIIQQQLFTKQIGWNVDTKKPVRQLESFSVYSFHSFGNLCVGHSLFLFDFHKFGYASQNNTKYVKIPAKEMPIGLESIIL